MQSISPSIFSCPCELVPRKDDSLRRELADERLAHIERMKLAIDLLLAYAARNQLRQLRSEIEDEDFLVTHGGSLSSTTKGGRAALPLRQTRS